MENKKNLIFDCDGVLYPLPVLPIQNIIEPMIDLFRRKLKISGEEQIYISNKTVNEKHLGMFNYIKEMCAFKNYDFRTFCRQLADQIDYSGIQKNQVLWEKLEQLSQQNQLYILSNNCREHIEKVVQNLFAKNLGDLEAIGMKIYDITCSERDGYFHPKQSPLGLEYFLQNIQAKPEDCTLFDDAIINIEAAQKIGMRGVLVDYQKGVTNYLAPAKLSKIDYDRN